jgi:predicted transposase YbfD/YdcC
MLTASASGLNLCPVLSIGGQELRYYLCSIALSALTFARAVRAHWGVENRLHWVLDVVFREDLVRFRRGDGPQNMVILRAIPRSICCRAPNQRSA